MKINSKYTFLALGAIAMLSSCDENSWNDHKLDGFEEPPVYNTTETINYTLTAADYSTLAGLSANKSIAEAAGESEALAAIGSNGFFATQEQARKYLPAFLSQSSFPYFALNDGSSLKISYDVASNLPAEVVAINSGIKEYTLDEADYIAAWGSSEDYIAAFAPMCPASKALPGILRNEFAGTAAGDYAVVTYNESAVNPIFGSVGGGDTPGPSWEVTSELADPIEGDNVTVNGYVTAICARGFILTDNGGSILCYQASGFDQSSVVIGSQVTVNGEISSYNRGYQIQVTSSDYEVIGTADYTYPKPAVQSVADIQAACAGSDLFGAKYVEFTGRLSVIGNYYNIVFEGTDAVQGSVYYVSDAIKAGLVDGTTYTFTGYFSSVSGGGRYYNVVLTGYSNATTKVSARRAPVGTIETTVRNAVYTTNGTAWSVPANTEVLQPSDYTAMGRQSDLSGTHPKTLLPIYLKTKFPFAQEGDTKTVVYRYYANSATTWRASQYTFTAGEWVLNQGSATEQFTNTDGEWKYNPSVIITLPYARNTDPSYSYYMACVNWVFEAICKPMGDTSLTSGLYFIDYRGNAEFYSGASAYYGNVDVRASSAKSHCPEGYTGYDGLSDDQISDLLKKRFVTETLPNALKVMNPDAVPVADMEVTYTINFTAYDGAATEETVIYTVSGPAEFKYKSCTWFTNGEDKDW